MLTSAVSLEASSRKGIILRISFPRFYSDVHQALLSEVSKQIKAVFMDLLVPEFPMKEVKQLSES